MHSARVVAGHRDLFVVVDDSPRLVGLAGRLRHAGVRPGVGDWVELDASSSVIRSVEPRRGVIARADPQTGREQVLAANVDVVFVVTSANRELNVRRLERFVALAGGIECVVLLNKIDLMDDPGAPLAAARSAAGSAPVLPISAQDGTGLDQLDALLAPGRTAVLVGASGVGKSTLLNRLLGEDVQAVAPIRAVDDRGRHTTVVRSLFSLASGAWLIDTPGLKLPRMTAATGAAPFDDLQDLAASCRFADCRHDKEPGCAVQAAIAEGRLDASRLKALRRLQREAAWAAKRR